MIPRLELGYTIHRPVEWPAEDPRTEGWLFVTQGRSPYRKIVVMVDADIIDDSPSADPPTERQLLSVLLKHELVTVLRYSDRGPPSGTPEVAPSCYEGWAVIKEFDPQYGWGVVHPNSTGNFVLSGVIGNAMDAARRDHDTDVYKSLPANQAAERRGVDVLAEEVAAQAIRSDLYITDRRYLLAKGSNRSDGTTVCAPREALAILGLYFRAQDEFPITDREEFDRGLFFWVGMRELLPEAWRWFGACVRHSHGASDDHAMLLLASSLLQRVDRALENRDAVHMALNRPQTNRTRDDALANLDVVLVFLMGAVDVAARVAHRVLQLPTAEYLAGWQRRDWKEQVRLLEPNLAAVTDPGTAGEHVLTILRLLRNSVHGTALDGIAYQRSSQTLQSLVGIPVQDANEVQNAMNALGGTTSWGASEIQTGRIHLDPGILVDRLFEAVLELLNDLMRLTPVETLSHVALTADDCVPPDESRGPFAPWARASIRYQLGF